ncbi:MAG: hypothetical protein Q9225_003188 [Loekoesia sp. 1 TL-2023]
MGANQSTGDDSGSGQTHSRPAKTCYYELLGVERHASDEEIKKAYRKKALELHPDRNYGNVEETTKSFAEVQSAYEILSDPQERAWYDTHRNVILRGDDDAQGNHYEHDIRMTTTEDIMKMLPRVNGCRDFSDSTASFYSTLRTVFDTLAREEDLACEWEELDPVAYPGFGNANDPYDPTVRSFYAAWSSFATRKTFPWADVYRYSEARDRRVRRLMEKENKRLREEAIREFNDAVRSLVAFVKRRDPRFKPSAQSEADRQKILRDATAAQAARSRAANRAKVKESAPLPRWAQPEEPAPSEASDSTEEETKETYECVVCNKLFKSENQFEAHEKSKKHVKAAQRMRREMHIDNESLYLGTQTQMKHDPVSGSARPTSVSPPGLSNLDAVGNGVVDTLIDEPAPLNIKDNAHGEKPDDLSTVEPHSSFSADPNSASISDDEYADREDIEKRIVGQQKDLDDDKSKHDEALPESSASTEAAGARISDQHNDAVPQPKMGRAKAKRAKKAAQKSSARAGADAQFKCAMCQAGFPSKTKLFNHITSLGHAQSTAKGTKGGKGQPR